MISASNSLPSNQVAAEFAVNISPSFVFDLVPNGTATTPIVTGSVTGGTGPFTYQWSTDSGILVINSPTSEATTFTLSGVNREREEVATLKVTDSSATPKVATRSVTISYQFGERF